MKSSTEFAKKQETPLDIDVRNQVMISLSSLIGKNRNILLFWIIFIYLFHLGTYICGMHSMR